MSTSGNNTDKVDARSPVEKIRDEIRRLTVANAESPTIPKVEKGTLRLDSIADLPATVTEKTRILIVQGRDPSRKETPDPVKIVLRVCCDLMRAGVSDELIFGILIDDRYEISKWSRTKGSSAENFVLHQIARAKEYAIDPRLMELNERHAVIENYGGRCRVLEEVPDHKCNGRPIVTFQHFDDFRNRYRHRKVATGYNSKGQLMQVKLGDWWLDHPARKQFHSVTFSPGKEIDGEYNLWRGFAVQSAPGNKHHRYMEHIRTDLCGGNDETYDYLVSWMARAVQEPDSPGEVAVVLRGKKGTGKTIFARTFGALFGRHYWAVSDAKHIVGNFNAHLRDCVVLFGDEAFWAGDKKHEGVLKALITGDTLVIEAKNVDVDIAANSVHLIMASNAQWVVPASYDERRFLVLDVATTHMQDKAYFGAIDADMRNGGLANLLHELKTRDLSNFDHRSVPSTAALDDQKLHSMETHEEWWYRKLCDGHLRPAHSEWEAPIPKDALIDDYLTYAQRVGIGKRTSATQLGRFLAQCVPELQTFMASYKARDANGDPQIGRTVWWRFPPVEKCREGFADHLGGPFAWPKIEIKAELPRSPGHNQDRPGGTF